MNKQRKTKSRQPINLAAKHVPPPKNFAGYGKSWIDGALLLPDDRVIPEPAVRSMRERYKGR